MTLEEALNETPIIKERDKESLLKCLKEDFPDHIEKWLYSESITNDVSLYQGDILRDIPICFIDEDGDPIEGKSFVSLASNTCDMQPKRQDFILVSPVIPIEEYKRDLESVGADVESKISAIRKNRIFSHFYLPAKDDFDESFIDFSQIISVHSEYLNDVKTNKSEKCKLSLSQNGFYLFLIKLGYHFARMEQPS